MRFQADFGNPNKRVRLAESGKFRPVVMGDFSRRANKEELSKLVGDSTVKQKPVSSAVETLLKNAVALYFEPSTDLRPAKTLSRWIPLRENRKCTPEAGVP